MQSRLTTGRAPANPKANSLIKAEGDRAWYERWLALDDHRLRILDGWCELQRQLESEVGWFALSEEARAEIEQISGLSDLDVTLRLIHRRLQRWLRALPTNATDDIAVVTASLEVAQRLLPAEENRVVHGLIARAARDLARMQAPW